MLSHVLKKTKEVDIIAPLVNYFASAFRIEDLVEVQKLISEYNQIRNLQIVKYANEDLKTQSQRKKMKESYENYSRFLCSVQQIAKKIGKSCDSIEYVWNDSLNEQDYKRSFNLSFEIFNLYYNLGILNFLQALANTHKLSLQQMAKKCIQCIKKSFYYFNLIKSAPSFESYRQTYLDASNPHLQALKEICQGVYYQIHFQHLETNQFASITIFSAFANASYQHFQKAKTLLKLLMLQSTNNQILDPFLVFVEYESMISQVLAHQKFGKHFCSQLQDNIKDKQKNIQFALYFYKQAIKKLEQGLSNPHIAKFLEAHYHKKQKVLKLKNILSSRYQKLYHRNNQIYSSQELKSYQAPSFPSLSPKCIFKIEQPSEMDINSNQLYNIILKIQSQTTVFITRQTEQSKNLQNQKLTSNLPFQQKQQRQVNCQCVLI